MSTLLDNLRARHADKIASAALDTFNVAVIRLRPGWCFESPLVHWHSGGFARRDHSLRTHGVRAAIQDFKRRIRPCDCVECDLEEAYGRI